MSPDRWFEQLLAALPDGGVQVSGRERTALLDLARVAAHSSERWAAPISTYLAGLALADHAPERRAEILAVIVAGLDDGADV